VTVLLVSPDFASHYAALGVLGAEARRREERVVVATGPALRPRVLADGFEHVELAAGAATAGCRAWRTSPRTSGANCRRSTRRPARA
jgi:UDP:flavonoid glycosyltransferase YjiC (YdhE family)